MHKQKRFHFEQRIKQAKRHLEKVLNSPFSTPEEIERAKEIYVKSCEVSVANALAQNW